MKNTIHVNLWAGPSTGKSGISGKLFGKLKEHSIDCELVREIAKEYVWDGSLTKTEQLIITAKQYEKEVEMHGKVDYIISDTSVLMGALYCANEYQKELLHITKHLLKNWDIKHYFLERDLTKEYEENGRSQKLEESIEIDFKIKKFLKEQGIFYKILSIKNSENKIFEDIIK